MIPEEFDNFVQICKTQNIEVQKKELCSYDGEVKLSDFKHVNQLLSMILDRAVVKSNLLFVHVDDQVINFTFSKEMKSLLICSQANVIDYATCLSRDMVGGLLDGKGYVQLVDFHPRHVPKGRTPEYLIVRAARTSTTVEHTLKNPKIDDQLVKYLYKNKHSSPFEMCNVTLCLMLPLPIAVQFLRHRTGKFNQFSQRYAEVDENLGNYNPLLFAEGIRVQDNLINKQSSIVITQDMKQEQIIQITQLLEETIQLQETVLKNYHRLIQLGLAKEIARFFLPQNQYTKLVMQFDLNNLIKLLRLRQDSHAQLEIQVYANAIADLTRPLFPITFQEFENEKEYIFLTKFEIEAIAKKQHLASSSKSDACEFDQKKRKLNI